MKFIGKKVTCMWTDHSEFEGIVIGQDVRDNGYLILVNVVDVASDVGPFFYITDHIISKLNLSEKWKGKIGAWAWPQDNAPYSEAIIVMGCGVNSVNALARSAPGSMRYFTNRMFAERLDKARQYNNGVDGETNGPSGLKFL